MADAFDVGPLLWVNDEIDQSLDHVLASVEAVRHNPQDVTTMRFSQTYLYQVSGALDMVGLEGCKLYCNRLEMCADQLTKKEVEATPALLTVFSDAINALKAYIQALLDGANDVPLRLYPPLKALMAAMDKPLDESELFFPEINSEVPKGVTSIEYSEHGYTEAMFKERAAYQKALLSWIQTKNSDAVADMHQALSQVAFAQHNKKVKTLWWAASAFVETLSSPGIAESTAAKKVCRKLDQAVRQLVIGEIKPNNPLLKNVLYYVAQSDVETETIQQVKTAFSLSDTLGEQMPKQAGGAVLSADELKLTQALKPEIQALHDIWESVSNSIDLEKIGARSDTTTVALDNVLITQFANKLNSNQAAVATLSQTAFVDCYLALLQASTTLRDDASKVTQGALIEVAAALNLLDDALSHYQLPDADMLQRLTSETAVLKTIEAGLYSQREVAQASQLDSDTITAIINDIQASLKVVEQSLDTFFRNPVDQSTLTLTPKPLKQLAAIFDMLNLPEPTQMVKACDHYIQYLQHDEYHENQADFELLAESLSMVGLYADEMPKVRAETATALADGIVRINNALSLANMEFVDIENEPLTVEEIVSQREKKDDEADQDAAIKAGALTMVDQAFDDELLDIYLTEAEELIAQIAQNLQSLRVNETALEPLTEVRRNYHTLKGSGRTVGLVGQAEVAAGVENFLNGVLENENYLNDVQITQLEKITAAFADWTEELRASGELNINQAYWLNQAHALYQLKTIGNTENQEKPAKAKGKAKRKEAYVLISGKHKVSKQLYDIFLNESMQNIGIIEQDVAKLESHETRVPEKRAKQAVHTLASNALASGFKPMGELCRALELWLDSTSGNWTAESLTLYGNVTKAVAKMWQSISKLKMPRAARALINLLNKATEKANEVGSAVGVGVEEAREQAADLDAQSESTSVIPTNNKVESVADIKDLNKELLAMFVEEANTILPEVGTTLRAWKSAPKEDEHAHLLQRLLHTLKGSARMAGQAEIGSNAHELEELVLQKAKQTPNEQDFEAMFIELDKIVGFFDKPTLDVSDEEITPLHTHDVLPVEQLANHAAGSLRLREDVLARLINDAGEVSIIRSRIDREMAGFKASSSDLTENTSRLRGYLRELEIEAETQMQSRMSILQEADEAFDPLEFDRFTRLQELTRMIAESVNDVDTIQSGLLEHLYKTEGALQQQSRMSRDLQQGLLGVRVLPFQQISERMQRIVRQTARELDKTVDLVIEGGATEVDRGILEKISAPLEHLLRNAVAHGIETKAERVSAGKTEVGNIRLQVHTQNDEIRIMLSDDGIGVDLEAVKEKAIESGVLAADADITEDTLLSVIFEPGFTTSSQVTQISGRGVGLDVVRNDISGLGGRIDMSSEVGKGAVFNIYLPITQSVAQVLMVRAGHERYALPVAMIEQAQKIKRQDLMDAYDAGKVEWNDVHYPIYHFRQLLGAQEHQIEEQAYASVLLLRSGLHTVALHVDEVIGNQEVVMKDVGSQLARVPGIVGATVTGDGDIVLIINPVLIASRNGSVSVNSIKPDERAAIKKPRILVVDDSLTMRKVLGRLLEREGYKVQVAKDGMDAMDMLQVNSPDVILTDIEMPRLDGFGLSRNIRDDARTANTPLIMISSRTADKHKNLAKEIGVDAFFGKPVQDEALLEKIKELLAAEK